MEREEIKELKDLREKLKIAEDALGDILNWNDDLEDEYGDPGVRAADALQQISEIF